MKGHPDVVEYLKFLLRGELAARDQYFLHSRRYDDLGYGKLFTRINHEMEEETQHADALLKRLLLLGATPDMTPKAINPGETVPDMLASDLKLEYEVQAALCKGIALCEQHQDFISRDMLRQQLADTEEDHAYWLEQQLRLIRAIGVENYLQSQI